MKSSRLEAFSDAVLAIIITIMVLELHPPEEASLGALGHVAPSFLTYLLSFVYLGIYWNNHHHMFQLVDQVSGSVLWANLHLMFWLSLFPFTTGWMDETGLARTPTVVYGANLLLAAVAYIVLQTTLLRHADRNPRLAEAIGSDVKGKVSMVLYVVGAVVSAFLPWLGVVIYSVVAVIWLIPDRRIERWVASQPEPTALDPD